MLVRRLPARLKAARTFSTCAPRTSYAETVGNLKIGKHTRVIYQGFTGRVATGNAKESIEYGTQIVGGVTPGKDGEHLGLPVLPTVRAAKEQLKPDATAVFVAASHALGAIEDAIEAEIPLIVAVAEHIPIHDILRITSMLNTQSKSRFVGANAPGIIAPLGQCRIGFQPIPVYAPGHIGVVAKSGTLSYETVGSITRAGLGQSLCIGMGGDIVAGTNLVDGLTVFENDPDTEAIVLVGEVGGRAEEDAAEWINDYRRRVSQPKPIVALVAGRSTPSETVMGHAGAWTSPGDSPAEKKYKALENAGATMVNHPEHFGGVLKTLLKQSGKTGSGAGQRRSFHSLHRPTLRPTKQRQQRQLHLDGQQAGKLLSAELDGIEVAGPAQKDSRYLSISIDRSGRQPCILVSPTSDPASVYQRRRSFPYNYQTGPDKETIQAAIQHLQLDAAPPSAASQAAKLISTLAAYHKSKEAISIILSLSTSDSGSIVIHEPQLHFDPSAFRSTKRQKDIHALRQTENEEPISVEAEKSGIVYVKLSPGDPEANIGTLVNGAGLAMNTVDAMALPPHNGKCANFLDTGGKATSETVKTSFELILRDERVKVIFVNIFGGLTDCGMIADGVIMAFNEVDMRGVPLVVRLRGTNEEVGQRKIAESGLRLEAFDGFQEAAARVVELARS